MKPDDTCECCHGHDVGDDVECCPGYLHMDDSCGRGPGIERCNECAVFDSDEEAQAAHDSECCCGLTVATYELSDADSDFSLHFS